MVILLLAFVLFYFFLYFEFYQHQYMSLPGKTCFQNDLSYVERDVNLLTHLFRYLLAAKFQAGYITPTAQSLILGDVKNVPNF